MKIYIFDVLLASSIRLQPFNKILINKMIDGQQKKNRFTKCKFTIFSLIFLQFTTSGCAKTKGCFVSPSSCFDSTDCEYLVTYKPNEDSIEFEISGKAQWVALGFSDDKIMVRALQY